MSPRAKLVAILEERLALMAPARRLRLAEVEAGLVARFGTGGRARILDAGCGDGLLTLAMARRRPAWSFVGVDLREDLLAGARRRAGARGLGNVDFRAADLERAPVDSASDFDAALAIECLSEIPDDRAALRALVGALRPGGIFVAHVPERDWKPVLPGSSGTWREQVRQGYDADELAAALRGAGLEEISVRPTYRSLAAGAQEIRDRIKDRGLVLRLLAFPFLAAAARLERAGVSWGRPNALVASGSKPQRSPGPGLA